MWRSLCILALSPYMLLVAFAPARAAPPNEQSPSMKPPEPKDGTVDVFYPGVVTELTKTSITLQFDGLKDQKPKRFLVSETLAAGKIPMEPRPIPGSSYKYPVMPADMYRLTDVKVGDWLIIHYARIDGVDICDHIRIQKRPGERVPPLSEEADPLTTHFGKPCIRYHEYANAYWDLVDKGIPYPEKFGEFRRFSKAPMPREKGVLSPKIMQ